MQPKPGTRAHPQTSAQANAHANPEANTQVDPHAQRALDTLLARIGLQDAVGATSIVLAGADPVVRSRHRYGAATAAALAAQGVAIAEIWRQRSGRTQQVSVDLAQAANLGLRTTFNLRQHGHAFDVGSTSRESNFFETADGRQIYLLRNNGRGTITENLIGLLGCANSSAGIAAAVRLWRAHDLEEALADRKLPGVVVRSRAEWQSHPQGRLLHARPGVQIDKVGDSAAEPFAAAARPLSGIRVLDASHVIAGPSLGRLLAEQGADVLHVTNPSERETQQIVMDLGFGKRGAYIDLDRVADVARLRSLVEQTDVFIDSWRPGALARRGFGVHDLARLRPGIVCVSISCYGSDGPWAKRGGYEPIGQAVCGLSMQEGEPGKPRNAPTITMNDYLAAYLGGAGVLGALVRRAREGGSYHVTTSLTQASMWVLALGQLDAAVNHNDLPVYQPGPGLIVRAETVFGQLDYVAPITRYSETNGYWERMPEPRGASPASWW